MADQQNNKDIIIENALRLFYEYGYKDTTLRMIAEKSGISHPSIFNHFRNKVEIANILLYRYISSLSELTKNFISEKGEGDDGYNAYLFYWTAHFFFLIQNHKFYDFAIDYTVNGDYWEFEDKHLYFKMLFDNLMVLKYKRSETQYKLDDQILTSSLWPLEKACFNKEITIVEAIFEFTEIVKAVTRIKIHLNKKGIVAFVESFDADKYNCFNVLEYMVMTKLGQPFTSNNGFYLD